jgi:hypothetical protein
VDAVIKAAREGSPLEVERLEAQIDEKVFEIMEISTEARGHLLKSKS